MARMRSWMMGLIQAGGFWGILFLAAYPNAFFDLCGICCGHIQMPFLKFFGATLLGKGVIKAHAAVHGLEVPTKDSIVECRIKLDGASMVDVELDDRKYTAAHYGHICRAQVRYDAKTKKGSVQIIDERDGNMKNETRAMLQDPARKAEGQKLIVGRSATFPADVKPGEWQTLVVEIVDDQIRVVLDGKPVGYLKSSGIAHATKSRFEFGVAGQAAGHSGQFDDLKIYSASAK